MKCECGYEGWAEIGEFKDEQKQTVNYRCPKCMTYKGIEYLDSIDIVQTALLYPSTCSGKEGRKHTKIREIVEFITGGAEPSIIGYSIHCPVCHWGSASTIPLEDFEKLKKKFGCLNTINVNVGLTKVMQAKTKANLMDMKDTILAIMKQKQFKEGFEMIPVLDIKEALWEQAEKIIKQMQIEGLAYKPRHHFLKLTQRD